jgi:hypothetical protein
MHHLNVLSKIKTNARRENQNTLSASRDAVRHFERSGRAFFFGPFSRAARPSREESLFPTTLLSLLGAKPKKLSSRGVSLYDDEGSAVRPSRQCVNS